MIDLGTPKFFKVALIILFCLLGLCKIIEFMMRI